jgi:hypothetical protein
LCTEFADMPLFWLFAEAAVNPKYIAQYLFPGVITGYFTHLEYIKVAPYPYGMLRRNFFGGKQLQA